MKKLRVAACMLMLALAGCDNNDNAPTAVKKMRLLKLLKRPLQKTRVQQNSPAWQPQKLAQQSAGKALTLLDL